MKSKLMTLAVIGVLVGGASSAWAVSAKEFACEKSVLVELGKVSRGRGKCIAKCVGLKQNAPPGTYSCTPPFDALTLACTVAGEDHYVDQIVTKCTGNMPLCGGYLKGYCSNDTSQTCDRDPDCSSQSCQGRCAVNTSQSCGDLFACNVNGTEACVHDSNTKDPTNFAAGNLHDGAPSVLAQIDFVAETSFLCRQRVCSTSGALCGSDSDCGLGESCDAGDCDTGGADCDYDGQCTTGKKKCFMRGRCSVTAQACNISDKNASLGCPTGETCLRYGRCTNTVTPPGSQGVCFDNTACPSGETCMRTAVQTNRTAELKCAQTVQNALGKLTFDIFNCEAKCGLERDLKLGQRCESQPDIKCKSNPDCPAMDCINTSCDHFAVGRCSGHTYQVCADDSDCQTLFPADTCNPTSPPPLSPTLAACRALALSKAKLLIDKKCPSLPACGAYSAFGGILGFKNTSDLLLEFVKSAQDGQFKEDNPDLSPGRNLCAQ